MSIRYVGKKVKVRPEYRHLFELVLGTKGAYVTQQNSVSPAIVSLLRLLQSDHFIYCIMRKDFNDIQNPEKDVIVRKF